MSPLLLRAGQWFLASGIQESNGGVARYYRSDSERNNPVSTEITGYAVSTLVYLHSLTHDKQFLARGLAAAKSLAQAWSPANRAMPFELSPGSPTYFFDCGVIVRGLLGAWRMCGSDEFVDVASELGRAMARDFLCDDGGCHPVLSLPSKTPEPRDATRWSRSAGCYQLKAAMAWWDLAEATGDETFRPFYHQVLEFSLRDFSTFLPGHPDPLKVMDRLHAFLYFLEGVLPQAEDPRCRAALAEGIGQVTHYLREIGPQFARSDVYAQLLRVRLFADWTGAVPLDRESAAAEARELEGFQAMDADPRIYGGFYFGRKNGAWLPFLNPVSTAFAVQALALWAGSRSGSQPHWHLLI